MQNSIRNKLVTFISTCGGFGLLPWFPGTWTSLGACIFWGWLLYLKISFFLHLLLCLGLIFAGVIALRAYEKIHRQHDGSEVVIDEWVGMGISLLGATFSWEYLIVAFLFFRVFDVWKPLGIRYFDDHYFNGWGVMLDDVLAGVYVCLIMKGIQWFLA